MKKPEGKYEVIRQAKFEVRRTEYRAFYDHEWSRGFRSLTKGTPLQQQASDLAISWKAAARAAELPFLMVECLADFYTKLMATEYPSPLGQRVTDGVPVEIAKRMKGHLSEDFLVALKASCRDLSLKFQATRAEPEKTFDIKSKYWDRLLPVEEFQIALWGSQRILYPSIVFAYEDFVLRCYKEVQPEGEPKVGDGFSGALTNTFGAAVAKDCWDDKRLYIARQVRHALAHNGGRLTPKLLRPGNRRYLTVDVVDDELHPMPADSKDLFNVMSKAAVTLTNAAFDKLREQGKMT